MKVSKSKLNPDKTGVLVVGPDSTLGGGYDLTPYAVVLPRKDQVHCFEVDGPKSCVLWDDSGDSRETQVKHRSGGQEL